MSELALLLGLLVAPALLAEEPAKPKGDLGSEWITPSGNSRIAQMRLSLDSEKGPLFNIYRPVTFDWPRGDLQQGRYPGDVAKDEEASLTINLAIGTDGRVAKCEIVKPARIASFNDHACPHIVKYAWFVPALSDEGKRFAKSYDAQVFYELRPRMMMPVAKPYERPKAKPALVISPPTLAMLGIDPATSLPKKIVAVAADVMVDAGGQVTACTLSSATGVDSLDQHICDRFKSDLRFKPAMLYDTGEAVEGKGYVYMYWPE